MTSSLGTRSGTPPELDPGGSLEVEDEERMASGRCDPSMAAAAEAIDRRRKRGFEGDAERGQVVKGERSGCDFTPGASCKDQTEGGEKVQEPWTGQASRRRSHL